MTKTTLQENLERYITEGRHKIRRLEREAGLSTNRIYDILKGTIKSPTLATIQAIAKVLGVSVDALILPYSQRDNLILTEDDCLYISRIAPRIIAILLKGDLKVTTLQFKRMLDEIYINTIHINSIDPDDDYIKGVIEKHLAMPD